MTQARHRSLTPRIILIFFALAASPALAIPYLISYEANTPGSFPEDEGWERGFGFGGATRTVENGIFTLSSDNISVFDFYEIDMQGNLDPDPGELFFAEWRLRVVEVQGGVFGDAGVTIARDGIGGPFGGGDVGFRYKMDQVFETGDPTNPKPANFEPGVFHTYRFESQDMFKFQFYIDGALSIVGTFDVPSVNESFVAFGDAVQGAASTTEWDFLRFGVIPEPSCAFLFALGIVFLTAGRKERMAHSD